MICNCFLRHHGNEAQVDQNSPENQTEKEKLHKGRLHPQAETSCSHMFDNKKCIILFNCAVS